MSDYTLHRPAASASVIPSEARDLSHCLKGPSLALGMTPTYFLNAGVIGKSAGFALRGLEHGSKLAS